MRKKLQTLAILMLGMAFMVNAQVTRLEIPIVKNGTQITDTIYVEDENGEDVIHSEVTFSLSSDDAEEIKNVLDGTHEIDDLNDDDLDLGWEGEADDNNIVNVGLRFQNVEIPKGAKIIRSYVRVVSHEVKTVDDDANIKIYGEASDNAETFTEDALITDRNKTNAVIDWKADQPWGLWTVEYSPDISEIVQEIVDRGGWASGNSLALIMEGENQGPSENENKREFEAFENISDPEDGGDGQHHPDRVPRLIVYFTTEDVDVEMTNVSIVKNGTQITDTIYVEDENGEDVIHSEVTFNLSSDDAEEIKNVLDGTHEIDDLNDDDLDLGWEGEADDNNVVNVGLRFQNISIPKDATIYSAYVEMVSHEVKTVDDVANIKIYGEASANAETFTEEIFSTRPKVETSVEWIADQPWGLWTVERTPDIAGIIQDIVNQEGWASGNALALIMEGENQGPSEYENKREFEAFENISDPEDGGDGQHHPDRVPKLVVYYSAGESTSISSFTSSVSTVDVYPNPAAYGELNVALQSVENAQIDIYNLTGKLVYSANTNPTQKVTTLDVSNFETGFYFIKVTQNNTVYSQKVLIK